MSVCYQDSWASAHPGEAGPTFSPVTPLVRHGTMPEAAECRLDYVMVRCGLNGPTLKVIACERVLVDPVDGVHVSDHYGVMADLAVPDHPPGQWSGEPNNTPRRG